IQPGIESLSSRVLQLMRKGVTTLQNIYLLKLCSMYGIEALWNFLVGFPGEVPEDYESVCATIDCISHLQPPYSNTASYVRFDRFSPYFFEPATHNVSNLQPLSGYRFVYPDADPQDLCRLAYYFDGDCPRLQPNGDVYQAISAAIRNWVDGKGTSALV